MAQYMPKEAITLCLENNWPRVIAVKIIIIDDASIKRPYRGKMTNPAAPMDVFMNSKISRISVPKFFVPMIIIRETIVVRKLRILQVTEVITLLIISFQLWTGNVNIK